MEQEKSKSTKWLSVQEAKTRMFQDINGFKKFTVVKDRNCIVNDSEELFMRVVFTPREWNTGKLASGKAIVNYTMKVKMLEFDREKNQWLVEEEPIGVYIPASAFKFLTESLKIEAGDEVSLTGAKIKNSNGYMMNMCKWRCIRRANPKSSQSASATTNYASQASAGDTVDF